MNFRVFAALAAAAILILPASIAEASGTLVLTKLGGKPQSYSSVRLALKSTKLTVSVPGKGELIFNQSSCSNTVEIMTCEPIGVALRTKQGAHEVDFSGGTGYFNLTKLPQSTGTTPPHTLPRNGLYLELTAADGTTAVIHGTLDVGVLTGQ